MRRALHDNAVSIAPNHCKAANNMDSTDKSSGTIVAFGISAMAPRVAKLKLFSFIVLTAMMRLLERDALAGGDAQMRTMKGRCHDAQRKRQQREMRLLEPISP